MRLSIDCKATVKIGPYSRGGKTRGDNQAADHDMGCRETYTPFGVAKEDPGELHLTFGSSAKTSDFIVDALQAWWEHCPPGQRERLTCLQIKADNGPESNGQRSQFLKRMVDFADAIGKPIQLLSAPTHEHSRYRRHAANLGSAGAEAHGKWRRRPIRRAQKTANWALAGRLAIG